VSTIAYKREKGVTVHTLKQVLASLALFLGSATTLLAITEPARKLATTKQLKIDLVPANRTIKYQYALSTKDMPTADLQYKDVNAGVTLEFDSNTPYFLYVNQPGISRIAPFKLHTFYTSIEKGKLKNLSIHTSSDGQFRINPVYNQPK
jgi:hypothetical protein